MKIHYYFVLCLLIISCEPPTSNTTENTLSSKDSVVVRKDSPSLSPIPTPITIRKDSCLAIAKSIKLAFDLDNSHTNWECTVTLPDSSYFAQESHYVTSNDRFNNERLFANSNDENIERHLFVSYQLYKEYDNTVTKEDLYDKRWKKEWTPAESGQIGQGSIGELQTKLLHPNDELWLLTMMWAKRERPDPGTKFLVEANGKAVIVVAGFETGPRYEYFLGGMTAEVHHWLGTDSDSKIKLSYLKNQNLPTGPVECY